MQVNMIALCTCVHVIDIVIFVFFYKPKYTLNQLNKLSRMDAIRCIIITLFVIVVYYVGNGFRHLCN